MTQNALTRGANMLRYKLDDLPSNADDAELQAIQFGAKKVTEQFQAVAALANTFVINSDKTVATSAMASLKSRTRCSPYRRRTKRSCRASRRPRHCSKNTGRR